jgi:cell division transport system permease protein
MSVTAYAGSMFRHGKKSISTGGLPFFFAVFITALGLFSLGAFATLVYNFRGLAERVGESVAAVAFLDVRDATAAEEIRARIALHPGVADAKLVSPEDALARATRGLGDQGKALEGVRGVQMPWVVELVPSALGADRDALMKAIDEMPGVDEVMHPSGEVTRIESLLRLLHGAGLFLGILICVVVVVVVGNAVRITVYQRRDEIAILKLVGATDSFVRVPLLLSGLVQGALGALAGLVGLALLHATLAATVRVALSGALGTFVLDPLPWPLYLALFASGALLGLVGALVSVGRYSRV